MKPNQSGFTLVEIAIVLLIVTILLGYTVAMFPRQQELKQYRAVNEEMDRIIDAIIGFAQVNGRLPCPTIPNLVGVEDGGGTGDCNHYGGFVPTGTLGISGRLNEDSLLLDPWGNPYRYYVTDADWDVINGSDFVNNGQMREVGIEDTDGDGFTDLDGRYIICDDTGVDISDNCNGAVEVFGNYDAGPPARYGGAPFVLLSMGKNWNAAPAGDELENSGAQTTATLGIAAGPSGNTYRLKDVSAIVAANEETTFVRRPTGFADDFDDVVRWISPNVLFSRMIQAGQLP